LRRAAKVDLDAYRPTSASHYFDYEHPRLVGSQRLFEAFTSPLGHGLAPRPRRLGDLAFHDAKSASAGRSGLSCGVILPHTPERAVPLTPLSPPHSPPLRFRTSEVSWGRQDCASRPLREDEASHCNPRCLPSIGVARAPARAETSPECGHVMGFRFDLVLGVRSPTAAALRFRAAC
jgi:hypothetical protein